MQSLLSVILLLLLDTSFSWIRMFIALFFSILISIFVGIYAARSKRAGLVIIPVLDILQTLPILAFFPLVIYLVVATLPGYIGINASVIFLIITSMVWNISFGVYESIVALPKEIVEVAELYKMRLAARLKKIYIPACMPRVVEQSILSWSIGLFYLVTSEVFSTGNANYAVKYGIGVALTKLAFSDNFVYYIIGIIIFIIFVVLTRFLFFMPLERRVTRFNSEQQQKRAPSHIVSHRKVFPTISYIHMPSIVRRKKGLNRQKTVNNIGGIGTPRHKSAYYAGFFAVALLIIIYLFATEAYLRGYEATVLLALAFSFVRVWIAFIIALAVAVPVSVYLVFMTKRSSAYLLIFQVIASIPATVLLPVIVISLKQFPAHGELVAFIVFFLSGIWYILFSAVSNSKTLSKEIIEVKNIFGLKGARAWKKVYISALEPGIITGGITAIAAEWNASIVAEYFTTSGISGTNVVSSVGIGIGKLLDVSLSNGNIVLMVTSLINLTVMIIIINTFLWKRMYRKVAAVNA